MNLTWAGQSCGSTSRVFLHASIHDRVLAAVAKLIPERHKPGLPTDPATTMGSLISQAQLDKVEGFRPLRLAEGARLVCGGRRPKDPALARGFFFEPTVFADMRPDMRWRVRKSSARSCRSSAGMTRIAFSTTSTGSTTA